MSNQKQPKEEKCTCAEMSCKVGCTNKHTHKGFFCEKCNPIPSHQVEKWEEEFDKNFTPLLLSSEGGNSDEVRVINLRYNVRYSKTRLKDFISHTIQSAVQEEREKRKLGVGFLRQWLNEDRITDPKRMVTNEQIEYMIDQQIITNKE